MNEPKYDEDGVNLGYLKKRLNKIQDEKANKEDIPTKTSELINDNNFVDENQLNMVLKYRGEAPNDLDNATTFGMYNLRTSYTNAPTTGNIYGILLIYPNKGGTHTTGDASKWAIQEVRTSTDVYIRYGLSSGWLNWNKLANEDDIPTTTSDLVNDSDFVNETQMNTEINKIDILNVHGTNIVENSNLDNYTTAGVYYASTGTIAASLSNTPVTDSGFKLIVEYLARTDRIVQTIKANNASTSAMWVRTNTGTWGEWKLVVGKKARLNTASFLTSAISTNNTNASVLSITGETSGGQLLIIGVIGGLSVTQGMGYVNINVDGTRTRIGATNSTSKEECTSVGLLTNVSAGNHTFSLDIQSNNASYTATAATYLQNSLTIIEL